MTSNPFDHLKRLLGLSASHPDPNAATPKKAEERPPSPPIEVGQRLMLNTIGAVTVSKVTARAVTLTAGEESWEFGSDEIGDLVRGVASPAEVEAVLAALGERVPDERSVEERTFELSQLLDRGSLADRARAFAEVRRGERKVLGGAHYRSKLKALVVGELAAATGTTARRALLLLEQAIDPTSVAKADPIRELRAHRRLPELEGHSAVGAIVIEREVAVGEGGPAWSAAAVPGVWYVYDLPDADEPSEVVALHHEAVAAFSAIEGWTQVAEPSIEGASMMIGDKDAMDDEEFLNDAFFARRRIVGHHAVLTRRDGDGSCGVLVPSERPIRAVRVVF